MRQFDLDIIARKELFACLVAVFAFRHMFHGRFVILNTDNTNARDWLRSRRTSNPAGNKLLMILELLKYTAQCKVSICWIPSASNRAADVLHVGEFQIG